MRYGKITLSAGVASDRFGEPLDQLLQRADRALYLAKDSGRNCVRRESDLPNAGSDPPLTVVKRPAG